MVVIQAHGIVPYVSRLALMLPDYVFLPSWDPKSASPPPGVEEELDALEETLREKLVDDERRHHAIARELDEY